MSTDEHQGLVDDTWIKIKQPWKILDLQTLMTLHPADDTETSTGGGSTDENGDKTEETVDVGTPDDWEAYRLVYFFVPFVQISV